MVVKDKSAEQGYCALTTETQAHDPPAAQSLLIKTLNLQLGNDFKWYTMC